MYLDWLKRYPSGGPSIEGRVQSEPVPATRMGDFMGLRSATLKARALLTANDASAGDLVQPLQVLGEQPGGL